jgi:hypothetical protein
MDMYQEGMAKCFSDITKKPSDDVIGVLIGNSQNQEIEGAICR